MEHEIEVLLIDHRDGHGESVAVALAEVKANRCRFRIEALNTALDLLEAGGVDVAMCEFNEDEATRALLERVLKRARSIPVVTFGPEYASVAAVAAGAEDHITPMRFERSALAIALQNAIERRRRWRTVEDNEARMRNLIQANADPLVIVDDSGTIRFVNRAAETLFNRKSEDLVGSVMGTPSGDADVVELSIVRPETNETIAAEMRVVEIDWGGETGYMESIRDVTHLRNEAQRAREAIRMRDHFLATLSHELRNPLAALTNAAQVLSLEHGHVHSLKLPTEIIKRQCHQMVRILDDLLDIARISQGKVEIRPEHVSLRELISDGLQAMRPRIDQTHKLTVELSADSLHVHVDPSRMQQVLANLVTNAVKYSPEGGEITIRAERVGAEAVLTVSDHGHGIPPDMLESIFEPFVQSEQALGRSDGGLGIGLAVVRRIMELHGGRVEATSLGLERGSRFTAYLPLSSPVAESAKADDPVCERRFKICVVEDIFDIAWMMRKLLEALGHEVVTAPDGETGLELILNSSPDVAFLDIGLPGINGYEVAEGIRKDPRGRNVVLVAVTGYGQSADRQRALDAGFDFHFVKPASIAGLRTCLYEIANRKEIELRS